MIEGVVNAAREAVVPLTVANTAGRTQPIDAVSHAFAPSQSLRETSSRRASREHQALRTDPCHARSELSHPPPTLYDASSSPCPG